MAVEPSSLSELISFLENLPEPHILCDRNYQILAANEAYRANWVDQTELVGRKCFEVSHRYTVPCDQAGESCPLQRSLQSGQRERVLHLHHTPKGEIFENIELSPIRDASGEIEITLPILTDQVTMIAAHRPECTPGIDGHQRGDRHLKLPLH